MLAVDPPRRVRPNLQRPLSRFLTDRPTAGEGSRMHSNTQSPTRAQHEPRPADGRTIRRRLKLPALLGGIGGLGLLGCVACCTLPLLGIIGIGGGAAAFFKIL